MCDGFCNSYRAPPAMFVVPPEYADMQKIEPFGLPVDPRPSVGPYPTQIPDHLADREPQMATERDGRSITNGKANRVLWGFGSSVRPKSLGYRFKILQ